MTVTHSAPYERSKPWQNFHGVQSSTPMFTARPTTEAEVVDAVRFALKNNLQVRALGGGYSFSPVVTTDGMMIDLRGMVGLSAVDRDRNRVRVLPGTRIAGLGDLLWDVGMSIPVQGVFNLQTIAGVIATGTHGTGSKVANISSNVTRIRLVDGNGEVVEIGEDQMNELQAAKVAIGMLGVITEVELQVVPKFFLTQTPDYPTFGEALTTIDADVKSNDHYALLWFPHAGSPDRYGMQIPEESKKADLCWRITYNRAEAPDVDTGERTWGAGVGRSYLCSPLTSLTTCGPDTMKWSMRYRSMSAWKRLQNCKN